jgi:hypothetical protein
MYDLEKRVADAAKLLDECIPKWRSRITRPIKIGESENCIIGQVLGDFWSANLSKLGYAPDMGEDAPLEMTQRLQWGIEHGFAIEAPHPRDLRQTQIKDPIQRWNWQRNRCQTLTIQLENLWGEALTPRKEAA